VGFLNLVFFKGYLTSPPQLRFRPDGTKICEFSLTIEGESPSFSLDVSYPGKDAEFFYKRLKARHFVFISGRLKSQKQQPFQGIFHPYRIIASSLLLLPSFQTPASLASSTTSSDSSRKLENL
jgi:single-stranded DNA-binding protein